MKNIKQKILGIIGIVASIFTIAISKEATFAVLSIPFSLYLVFAEKDLFAEDAEEAEENME